MNDENVAAGLVSRLFEDEHFLFVNKPAGLSVHSPRKGIAWGVIDVLEQRAGGGSSAPLRACYRLEKYTSGVLALAKSAAAAERLGAVLAAGEAERRFVAVVRGKPVKPGVRRDLPGTKKPEKSPSSSKEPTLGTETINSYPNNSLIRVTPHGRGKLRIRAVLSGMNIPVLGDVEFAARANKTQSGRFYLHLESITLKHPFTGEPVHVYVPAPTSFDAVARGEPVLDAHLEVAIASRVPCLIDADTDAFRLFNAKVDGVSGLLADKYGDVIVLHTIQGKFNGNIDTVRAAAKWFSERLDVSAVYLKNIPHDRSRPDPESEASLTDPQPIWGKPSEPEIPIRENGISYRIRPYDGYLTGLFLDHRENRGRIRDMARDKRVLNLFSHTCGFSVAAAIGGAASTASVDISKKSLEWGKLNFAANGINMDDHRFYCTDVFDFFKRAEKQGHRFDLIVADPPTFARTKKPPRVFQITKDMVRLVKEASTLLEAGGVLLVSMNNRELSIGWLREQVAAAVGAKRFRVLETPELPPDFIGARDANKCLIVQL